MKNGQVTSGPFFFAIRKNKTMKTLASAIARDPDGTSRIPIETF